MRAIEFISEMTGRRGFLKGAGAMAASSMVPKKAILSLLQNASKIIPPQVITATGAPTQYSINQVIECLADFVNHTRHIVKGEGLDPDTADEDDLNDIVQWNDMLNVEDTLEKLKANKTPTWQDLGDALFSYDTEFRETTVEMAEQDIEFDVLTQIEKNSDWEGVTPENKDSTDTNLKAIEQQVASSGLTPDQLKLGLTQLGPKLDDHMKYVASLISKASSANNAIRPQAALPAPTEKPMEPTASANKIPDEIKR